MTREFRFNFGKCVLRDKIIDGVENHGHMLRHLGKGCEPRIIGQGVTADRAQQPLRGFPIGCAEHTPRRKVHRLAQPVASRRMISARQGRNGIIHQPKQGFEHCKIDDLTACGSLFAGKQCDHDPQCAHQPRRAICRRKPGMHRRPVGETGQMRQTAHGLSRTAKSRYIPHRAVLSVAGHAQNNQIRVPPMQYFRPDGRTLKYAWSKILDKDIGTFNQLAQDAPAFVRLPIQTQSLLVAAQCLPPNTNPVLGLGSEVTHHVRSVRCFDFDDIRTEIRKQGS